MMLTTVVERKHSTFNLPAADSWPRINEDYANLRNLPPDLPSLFTIYDLPFTICPHLHLR